MGWASASSIMSDIIKAVKPIVPLKEDRKKIYKPIYDALVSKDWDTTDECVGKDEAYDEIYQQDCIDSCGFDPFEKEKD